MTSVLFVCNGLYRGGTEKTLVEGMNILDGANYDISLYVRRNCLIIRDYINDNVKVVVNTLPERETPLSFLCGVVAKFFGLFSKRLERRAQKVQRKIFLNANFNRQAREYFKGKRYDYAVAYDMAQECADFVLNKIKAKKKIAFFHGSTVGKTKARSYKKFDKIVGVNEFVAEAIKTQHPSLAKKVTDIENYINPKWVTDELALAEKVVMPKKDLILCTVGRISPEKGFDLATETAKILKERGVSFQWYFIGDIYDGGKTLRLIDELGVKDEITITGFLDSPFGYINSCDIYVQPSYEEAHATTILEAAILKKPIVSTDTIAGNFFFEKYHNCVLSGKEPQSLAESIISLFNDKEKMQALEEASASIDYELKREVYKKKIHELLS